MKFRTKMIVVFLTVILAPVLMLVLTFWGINRIQIESLRQSYGITDTEGLIASDYFQIFSRLTQSMRDSAQEILDGDVACLTDPDYLDTFNEELEEKNSFLVIRRDGEIVYSGDDSIGKELYRRLPEYAGKTETLDMEGFYLGGKFQYLVSQRDFLFNDGSEGSLFIVTSVSAMLPAINGIIRDVIYITLLVLILTAFLLVVWLYSSMVRPLGTLRKATREIRDGNLDFAIDVEGRDEISELCMDFEQMRRHLKENAEEKMKYDSDSKVLISNISHDLKTPITAIKGYCEGIMDGVASSPEKLDKYVRTIYNKANDMANLIDELSIYSKIDTNRIPYNFTQIHVDDYFRDCADELRMDLESKNIDLTYYNYLDEDAVIIGDAEQLKRVVNNIVSNSVKYLDKKKGIINIRIRDAGDFVQIELEDNGSGIAKKDLPYIFDRFFRADASRNSSTGGSGIGLSIVKKIIEDHGGRIWATSREGTGTIMHFVLRKYQEVPANE